MERHFCHLKIYEMKKAVFLFLFVSIAAFAKAQDLEAYKVYTAKGKKADFGKMTKTALENQVVLFGELHNNPICHWLQLELTKAVALEKPISLGAEMFETDDQVVMNEYLAGFIKLDHLKKEAKVWPNFETDYLPLVDFAKAQKAPFIATNVPRRYASLVSKKGQSVLDSLSAEAKRLMPPLPFNVNLNDAGYIEMREMMGMHMQGNMENFIAAQAIKDYTMAANIMSNLPENGVFIHYNGSFHSQNYAGIYNYLKNSDSNLKIMTIAVVEADNIDEFDEEWENLADYIIVVPSTMTKTH